MKIINADDAPKAIGPYVQAISVNGLLFLSGQLGMDPSTMKIVEGGAKEQVEQVLKNIAAVLKEAGIDKNKVIKATMFLQNMEDFASVNEVYAEFFGSHKPARSTVQVAKLPLGALVEIEIVASL